MMRAIKLDFAERQSALRRAGFVLFVSAVAVAAYVGHAYVQESSELQNWEAKWSSLQKAHHTDTDVGQGKKADWERLQTELKIANKVVARLAMPWGDLFREIETSVDENVSLLNVEPDTEKSELRIMAEAKNFTAMLDYIKRLRASEVFKDAHIQSHQVQVSDPQKPVRFMVNAKWTLLPQKSYN